MSRARELWHTQSVFIDLSKAYEELVAWLRGISAYRNPIISRASFTSDATWCRTGIAQASELVFTLDLLGMGYVRLVVMILEKVVW